MFEREIKFINDFNLNKLTKNGYTFFELSQAGLHPCILKYISAEIDYLVFEDRSRLLENSNFDYSGEVISHYFDLIGEEIRKSKKFNYSYLSGLILQAAAFNVSYVAEPRTSIMKLLFENKETILASELKQILRYIYYYGYFTTVIEKYITRKKIVSIAREEFSEIIKKIDSETLSVYSNSVIDKTLHAMGDIFNMGSSSKNKIPLTAVELFIKEKGLQEYIEKLAAYRRGEYKSNPDISEIRNILFAPPVPKVENFIDKLIQREQQEKDEPFVAVSPATVDPLEEKKEDIGNAVESERIADDSDNLKENVEGLSEDEVIAEADSEDALKIPEPANPGQVIETGEAEEDKVNTDRESDDISELKDREEITTDELSEDEFIIDIEDNSELSFVLAEDEKPFPGVEEKTDDMIPENKTAQEIKLDDKELVAENNKPEEINSEEVDSEEITPEEVDLEENIPESITSENKEFSDVSGDEGVDKIEDSQINETQTEEVIRNEGEAEEFLDFSIDSNKDIVEYFSEKDIQRILNGIFKGNAEEFAQNLMKISECETQEEAFELMTTIFKVFSVKPYAREAERFKEIVLEYFRYKL